MAKPPDATPMGFPLQREHDGGPAGGGLGSAAAVETLLNRLADALFALDEISGMLQRSQGRHLDWLEPHILKIYDEVNDLMKYLSGGRT